MCKNVKHSHRIFYMIQSFKPNLKPNLNLLLAFSDWFQTIPT